jgi:hypothetical protein
MNLAKNITKVLAIVPLLFIITTHTFAYGALTSNSIMMSNSNESGTNVTYALTSQINNNQTSRLYGYCILLEFADVLFPV